MAFAQPATFNEPWEDARVASYLNQLPPEGENADFHALYHAYKQMRPYDFDRFLAMFTKAGRDLDAQNKQGQTLDQLINGFHNHSADSDWRDTRVPVSA